MGPCGQKSLQEGPISQDLQKNKKKMVKLAVFEAENPLEMGLDLQKNSRKLSIQPFFEWERSLIG